MQLGYMASRKINQTFTIMPRVSMPSWPRELYSRSSTYFFLLSCARVQSQTIWALRTDRGSGRTSSIPLPRLSPALRADRPDIHLFTISSELGFLVSARWISPSHKLLLLLLHHPYLGQLSGLIHGRQTDSRQETNPAGSIKGQMWPACSNDSAWW